jgi:hypothetical protein
MEERDAHGGVREVTASARPAFTGRRRVGQRRRRADDDEDVDTYDRRREQRRGAFGTH